MDVLPEYVDTVKMPDTIDNVSPHENPNENPNETITVQPRRRSRSLNENQDNLVPVTPIKNTETSGKWKHSMSDKALPKQFVVRQKTRAQIQKDLARAYSQRPVKMNKAQKLLGEECVVVVEKSDQQFSVLLAPNLSPVMALQPSHVNLSKLNKKFGEVVPVQKMQQDTIDIDDEVSRHISYRKQKLLKIFGEDVPEFRLYDKKTQRELEPTENSVPLTTIEPNFERVAPSDIVLESETRSSPEPEPGSTTYDHVKIISSKMSQINVYFSKQKEQMKNILDAEQVNLGISEDQFSRMRTKIMNEVDQYCEDVIDHFNQCIKNVVNADAVIGSEKQSIDDRVEHVKPVYHSAPVMRRGKQWKKSMDMRSMTEKDSARGNVSISPTTGLRKKTFNLDLKDN